MYYNFIRRICKPVQIQLILAQFFNCSMLVAINLKRLLLISFVLITCTAHKTQELGCLQRVMEKISGNHQDHYVFYLFGMGLQPARFPDCQPKFHPFFQMLFLTSPVVPLSLGISSSVNVFLHKHTTKLAENQFDIIITPACTPYYPAGSLAPIDPVFQNIEYNRLGWALLWRFQFYKFFDEYGKLHFQGFVSRPTTMFVLIQNCASKFYKTSFSRDLPMIPTIILVNPKTYQFSLLKQLRREIPLQQRQFGFKCINPIIVFQLSISNLGRPLNHLRFGYFKYMYAYRYPNELPSQCLNIVFKLSPVCSSQIMSILTLARDLFNETVTMYNYFDTRELRTYNKLKPINTIFPLLKRAIYTLYLRNITYDNTIHNFVTMYNVQVLIA